MISNTLTDTIGYKAEEAGTTVIFVDPKNTSQMCSGCTEIVPKDLSDRIHICNKCGLRMCRDQNAAINILKRGRVGTDSPVVKPRSSRL